MWDFINRDPGVFGLSMGKAQPARETDEDTSGEERSEDAGGLERRRTQTVDKLWSKLFGKYRPVVGAGWGGEGGGGVRATRKTWMSNRVDRDSNGNSERTTHTRILQFHFLSSIYTANTVNSYVPMYIHLYMFIFIG